MSRNGDPERPGHRISVRSQLPINRIWNCKKCAELEEKLTRVTSGEASVDVLIGDKDFVDGLTAMLRLSSRDSESHQNVDDARQRILMKLLENPKRIEGNWTNIPNLDSLVRLLYVVIRHDRIDAFRYKSRRPFELSLPDDTDEAEKAAGDRLRAGDQKNFAFSDNILERIVVNERNERLYKAIQRLPGNERNVVMLKLESDHDFRTIGAAIGKSHTTARALYNSGIAHLRKDMAA